MAPSLVPRQDATSTTTAPSSHTSASDSGSTSSKILYIAIGVSLAGVALLVLLCTLCICFRRRHRRKNTALSKPPIRPETHSLQTQSQTHQSKPAVPAPAKPSHYGGANGYAASTEQSQGLLANAAPAGLAEVSEPNAYTGEGYGGGHGQGQGHGFQQQQQHPQRPQQVSYGPPQRPASTASAPLGVSVTPPVSQLQRPLKVGEAATYFDTSVHIGTQRGRAGDRGVSAERRERSLS
ncbi:uncharacterized protein HMPREF1541_07358 [Cyphellophora europaea CBS 101466]|uniref:Uncharacterized protein n=1 Tax=Cyphellophora europaea (strain CBS 101466) TaxID=1220924 RepID=W2RN21_CYPE1|nr:uncharacterized protein HMPREF1541_07358 [Cyphellophora europaea CBS 101466]ETN37735.1 hypothetical protein HMPREF1541_07358 [Cyphellophora europaea CBS 101466]